MLSISALEKNMRKVRVSFASLSAEAGRVENMYEVLSNVHAEELGGLYCVHGDAVDMGWRMIAINPPEVNIHLLTKLWYIIFLSLYSSTWHFSGNEKRPKPVTSGGSFKSNQSMPVSFSFKDRTASQDRNSLLFLLLNINPIFRYIFRQTLIRGRISEESYSQLIIK